MCLRTPFLADTRVLCISGNFEQVVSVCAPSACARDLVAYVAISYPQTVFACVTAHVVSHLFHRTDTIV